MQVRGRGGWLTAMVIQTKVLGAMYAQGGHAKRQLWVQAEIISLNDWNNLTFPLPRNDREEHLHNKTRPTEGRHPPPHTHTHTGPDTTNHLHGSHLPVVEQQEDGLQDLIGGGRRVETARQCQDTGIDTTQ